jgi:RNA polymerase sigma-70 factor (ECF subfamily)
LEYEAGAMNDGQVVPPSHDSTDLSLLERVKDDPSAWERLVELYGPLVYCWCQRSGLGREDSADVIQEVFLAVSTHIAGFRRDRAGGTFRGWLRTITANKIRDLFRRRQGSPEAPGGSSHYARLRELPAEELESSAGGAGPDTSRALLHRALQVLRGEFDERTWQAFWRTTIDEESSAEAAASLGMSANAVRKAKARVLRRLRTELRDLFD